MDGNGLKWMEMAVNGLNSSKRLDITEISENYWKWVEFVGMAYPILWDLPKL